MINTNKQCYMSLPFYWASWTVYFWLRSCPCHTVLGVAVGVELELHVLDLVPLVSQNSSDISSAQTRSLSKDTCIGSLRGLSTGRTSALLSCSFTIRYGPWNGLDSLYVLPDLAAGMYTNTLSPLAKVGIRTRLSWYFCCFWAFWTFFPGSFPGFTQTLN